MAISEGILALANQEHNPRPRRSSPRTTQLDAIEFIRRCFQHVLPIGVMKVRHFGFMNAHGAVPTNTMRLI